MSMLFQKLTMKRLDKRTSCEKHMDFDFSWAEACLAVLGSETLETDLGILYSKLGLGNATANKFAKQNSVKINNNNAKTEIVKNENVTTKDKTQQRTKLWPLGEILENRFSHKVQLVLNH